MAAPTLNPAGDYTYFTTGFKDIAVATTTADTNMRYTINGSPPTSTSGTLIASSNGTVRLTPSPAGTTLQVIAFKPGMNDSGVNSGTYYYDSDNGTGANDSAVNSANMPNPNPGDGGPGGGVIPQDGQTISYDANGNLISYKAWVYRYDAQNRLIYASNGTTSATFYYDGKNRQIARNINGVIRFNSWDGWELVEEYSSSLNVATGYLQGTTGVIKSWSAANTLYYYQDKLGSTTHIASASGQLVESYHYDLTGTPTETSTRGVVDLYAGERWIPELRLYDLRNRFMSPELGRFLQADPIGLQIEGEKLSAGQKAFFFGGHAPEAFSSTEMNLYRYCHNDPVDKNDPTGLADLNYAESTDVTRAYNPENTFVIVGHGNPVNGLLVNKEVVSSGTIAKDAIANGYNSQCAKVEIVICGSGTGGKDSLAQKVANALAKLTGAHVEASAPNGRDSLTRTKNNETGVVTPNPPGALPDPKFGTPGKMETFKADPPKKNKKDE